MLSCLTDIAVVSAKIGKVFLLCFDKHTSMKRKPFTILLYGSVHFISSIYAQRIFFSQFSIHLWREYSVSYHSIAQKTLLLKFHRSVKNKNFFSFSPTGRTLWKIWPQQKKLRNLKWSFCNMYSSTVYTHQNPHYYDDSTKWKKVKKVLRHSGMTNGSPKATLY